MYGDYVVCWIFQAEEAPLVHICVYKIVINFLAFTDEERYTYDVTECNFIFDEFGRCPIC